MDLMNFDQDVFERIKADYTAFAERIELKPSSLHFVPMSALKGDNVVNRSERAPWYQGQSLMEILEVSRSLATVTSMICVSLCSTSTART